MIKQLAIWYLRKRKVQIIMNINFLEDVKITGKWHKEFLLFDNNGKDMTIYPNYKEVSK